MLRLVSCTCVDSTTYSSCSLLRNARRLGKGACAGRVQLSLHGMPLSWVCGEVGRCETTYRAITEEPSSEHVTPLHVQTGEVSHPSSLLAVRHCCRLTMEFRNSSRIVSGM